MQRFAILFRVVSFIFNRYSLLRLFHIPCYNFFSSSSSSISFDNTTHNKTRPIEWNRHKITTCRSGISCVNDFTDNNVCVCKCADIYSILDNFLLKSMNARPYHKHTHSFCWKWFFFFFLFPFLLKADTMRNFGSFWLYFRTCTHLLLFDLIKTHTHRRHRSPYCNRLP